jgi:hypothetical protein
VRRLEAAAAKLVAERLLLAEDAERLVATAKSNDTVSRFAGEARGDAVVGTASGRQ